MKRDPQRPEECPGRPEPPPLSPSPLLSSPPGEAEGAEPTPPVWIFGYGSLVWRPGFEFTSRKVGFIRGYSRRFWQGDTFHRGSERMVRAVGGAVGAAVGRGVGRWAAVGGGSASNGCRLAFLSLSLTARPGGDAAGGLRGEYRGRWRGVAVACVVMPISAAGN